MTNMGAIYYEFIRNTIGDEYTWLITFDTNSVPVLTLERNGITATSNLPPDFDVSLMKETIDKLKAILNKGE